MAELTLHIGDQVIPAKGEIVWRDPAPRDQVEFKLTPISGYIEIINASIKQILALAGWSDWPQPEEPEVELMSDAEVNALIDEANYDVLGWLDFLHNGGSILEIVQIEEMYGVTWDDEALPA